MLCSNLKLTQCSDKARVRTAAGTTYMCFMHALTMIPPFHRKPLLKDIVVF